MWISLASATGAVALVFLLWSVLKHQPEQTSPRRTLSDVTLDWVCDDDPTHRFRARGRAELRHCQRCGEPAHIVLQYSCPTHGEFEVMVQFEHTTAAQNDAKPSGGEVLKSYRRAGLDWVDYGDNVWCPEEGCERKTIRLRRGWGERQGIDD